MIPDDEYIDIQVPEIRDIATNDDDDDDEKWAHYISAPNKWTYTQFYLLYSISINLLLLGAYARRQRQRRQQLRRAE